MSHTNPRLNDGTSSVTILHGWREREIECVCVGGGLFPKFAPQGRLFDIHPSTGGTLVGEPKKIYSL